MSSILVNSPNALRTWNFVMLQLEILDCIHYLICQLIHAVFFY